MFYRLFLTIFLLTAVVSAEEVRFLPGRKVHYEVEQQLNKRGQLLCFPMDLTADLKIGFDLEMISEEEVVIHVKTLSVEGVDYGLEFAYKGDDKRYEPLMREPLYFYIGPEGQVEELFSTVDKLDDEVITPSFFEFFLKRLFDFKDKEIVANERYPIALEEYFNYDDEPYNPLETTIEGGSFYTVTGVEESALTASLEGTVTIKDIDDRKGYSKVSGDVSLDLDEPLLQQRSLKLLIVDRHYLSHVRYEMAQKWTATLVE